MNDIAPPRSAERALEALGADRDFCDAVIGDLAEEFAIRATWDGPAVARRWYYRETLRVAPHLLRNWWGSLRRRDVGYFSGVLGVSSVCVVAFEAFMQRAVHGVAYALGAPPGTLGRWSNSPFETVAYFGLMLLWTLADGIFGGYIAGRIGRRAPLPSALLVGVAFAGTMVVQNAMHGGSVLAAYLVMNVTTLIAGMIAGALLRAGSLRTSS